MTTPRRTTNKISFTYPRALRDRRNGMKYHVRFRGLEIGAVFTDFRGQYFHRYTLGGVAYNNYQDTERTYDAEAARALVAAGIQAFIKKEQTT